jgi:hypothetical protein
MIVDSTYNLMLMGLGYDGQKECEFLIFSVHFHFHGDKVELIHPCIFVHNLSKEGCKLLYKWQKRHDCATEGWVITY